MFGEAAQQLISQKKQNENAERLNNMMSEQQIVEADKARANQIASQMAQMMERQRQIMRDENSQLINAKKN